LKIEHFQHGKQNTRTIRELNIDKFNFVKWNKMIFDVWDMISSTNIKDPRSFTFWLCFWSIIPLYLIDGVILNKVIIYNLVANFIITCRKLFSLLFIYWRKSMFRITFIRDVVHLMMVGALFSLIIESASTSTLTLTTPTNSSNLLPPKKLDLEVYMYVFFVSKIEKIFFFSGSTKNTNNFSFLLNH